MRNSESEKLSTPVPDESVNEKYIGETEKNLAPQLDTDPPVIVRPWWKRLLRR